MAIVDDKTLETISSDINTVKEVLVVLSNDIMNEQVKLDFLSNEIQKSPPVIG